MFTPVKYDSGKVLRLPVTASATLTKFNHCKMTSGYLAAGDAGDNEASYIALETVTDATAVNGSTFCDVLPVDDAVEFEALCTATLVQATHVGNDYDFSTAAIVDLAATTDKIFHIDAIVGAGTDRIAYGRFNKPALA